MTTLRYDPLVLAGAAIIPLLPVSIILIDLLNNPVETKRLVLSGLFFLYFASVWVVFWSNPTRVDISGAVLSARWLFGRQRSWLLADLRRRQSRNVFSSSAIEVVSPSGAVQFRLWSKMLNLNALLEAVEPYQNGS